MNVLSWIVFGLLAGGIAKLIMPGKDPGGCLTTIVIGIIGSLIGGFLGTQLFGVDEATTFNLRSLGLAVLGAFLLLLLFRLLIQRRAPKS